jgi:hypothetical protein
MSTIPIHTYGAGDPILASEVNADFAAIQTGTAALTDENTRTEWCSRAHIDEFPATRTFNRDFDFIENDAATFNLTSNTWVQIVLGAAFRITYITPIVLEPGQVLRAHFDVNVMSVTTDNAVGPQDAPTTNSTDCYQFSFWIQDGSLQVKQLGCTSTYSTTIRPIAPAAALGVGSMDEYQRIGQRCNHTLCYVNNTNANVTINWIEVRGRLWDTAWLDLVTLRYGTFTVFTGRY